MALPRIGGFAGCPSAPAASAWVMTLHELGPDEAGADDAGAGEAVAELAATAGGDELAGVLAGADEELHPAASAATAAAATVAAVAGICRVNLMTDPYHGYQIGLDGSAAQHMGTRAAGRLACRCGIVTARVKAGGPAGETPGRRIAGAQPRPRQDT
ncbi:MAG TPA: hypothetical protein VIX86_21045 [Streptosporangiaceae bacterium]